MVTSLVSLHIVQYDYVSIPSMSVLPFFATVQIEIKVGSHTPWQCPMHVSSLCMPSSRLVCTWVACFLGVVKHTLYMLVYMLFVVFSIMVVVLNHCFRCRNGIAVSDCLLHKHEVEYDLVGSAYIIDLQSHWHLLHRIIKTNSS
jgi:hypothetical protein